MASRRTRINRVEKAWPVKLGTILDKEYAAVAVDAAGCPDLMGTKEVIAELGVTDLRKVAGLPDPVAEVEATRLWDADAIKALARERKRNPPSLAGARRWNSKPKQKART